MALKAIAIKTAGAGTRRKRTTRGRHNLLELFDALGQSTRDCIDQQARQYDTYRTHGPVQSILASHKDDFNDFRYLGESWRGKISQSRRPRRRWFGTRWFHRKSPASHVPRTKPLAAAAVLADSVWTATDGHCEEKAVDRTSAGVGCV